MPATVNAPREYTVQAELPRKLIWPDGPQRTCQKWANVRHSFWADSKWPSPNEFFLIFYYHSSELLRDNTPKKNSLRTVTAKAGTTREDELLVVTGISVAYHFFNLARSSSVWSTSQNTGKKKEFLIIRLKLNFRLQSEIKK